MFCCFKRPPSEIKTLELATNPIASLSLEQSISSQKLQRDLRQKKWLAGWMKSDYKNFKFFNLFLVIHYAGSIENWRSYATNIMSERDLFLGELEAKIPDNISFELFLKPFIFQLGYGVKGFSETLEYTAFKVTPTVEAFLEASDPNYSATRWKPSAAFVNALIAPKKRPTPLPSDCLFESSRDDDGTVWRIPSSTPRLTPRPPFTPYPVLPSSPAFASSSPSIPFNSSDGSNSSAMPFDSSSTSSSSAMSFALSSESESLSVVESSVLLPNDSLRLHPSERQKVAVPLGLKPNYSSGFWDMNNGTPTEAIPPWLKRFC
jgi:hypothetical protein